MLNFKLKLSVFKFLISVKIFNTDLTVSRPSNKCS